MPASRHISADAIRDLVDEQRLGDGRARLADHLRDLLVRVAELLLQHVQAFRFFERRQVLALDVLDQRDLEISSSSTSSG
jgi:hypothetical protein